jgi:hypothetical protein
MLLLLILAVTVSTATVTPSMASSTSTSAIKPPPYVGVPGGANATYFQQYNYNVLVNGSIPIHNGKIISGTVGGFNDTLTLVSNTQTSTNALQIFFNFELSISNVHVSSHYNSTFALKAPPTQTVVFGNEITNNYSLSPYFIISPNAPNATYIHPVPYENISVERLPSYTYNYGSIHFDGPVIMQNTVYQEAFPSTKGVSIIKNTYVYDAKSGLLIYWTNTTLYLLPGKQGLNNGLNITSSVYMTQTNINSINPSGNVSPAQSPTIPTSPSSILPSPFIVVLIMAVIILVVVVVGVFVRRR